MIRAAVLDAGVDLRGPLAAIAEYGIQFRVNEESGSQVIWVNTQDDADKVVQALARWEQLREEGVIADPAPGNGSLGAYFPFSRLLREMAAAFLMAPVTMLLILAAVIVALVSSLGSDLQPVRDFFYPAFVINPGSSAVLQLLGQIDSMRLFIQTLTPVLLHFGAIHIVFNSLWIWQFGRMIERTQSSLLYLVVVLWIAFFSNATQYLWTLTPNFGGLSGVVYGLLGYIWMWQLVMPYGRLRLPPAMIGVLLLALVLMEVLASSWIASAAHVGGLVAGMIAGLLTAGISKLRR
ncbi:MAG: rhomboid family intramembrane serine protease [Pseudomonadales bacterium]|nr:rhomboid family intramembrane serine protease [Pseudomonadales bacterium]